MTVYYKNNRDYPSVTTVANFEPGIKPSRPGNAAKLGSIIHYHIWKNYREDLEMPTDTIWGMDHETINERIELSLSMWNSLQPETLWQFVLVETLFFDDRYGYAGRPDSLVVDNFGRNGVLDIKTGKDYPNYDLQMAAYARMTGSEIVYLVFLTTRTDVNPSGKAQIRVLEKDQLDDSFERFLSKLDLYREYHEID